MRARSADKVRQRRADLRTVAVGSIVLLITPIIIGGASQFALLLAFSLATGGLLWKIPPFEIPHEGKFWELTKTRFWEAALFAAKQAAAMAFIAVIISPFYALLTNRSIPDTALAAVAIGAALGTAIGCLGWVMFRVIDDAEILRAEKEKASMRNKSNRVPRK